MARTTTRITIPTNSPDLMLKLLAKVDETHQEQGDKSPLAALDMETYQKRLAEATAKRAQAAKLEAQAQALNAQVNTLLGTAPGQSSKTPDTLYFDLCKARDLLLVVHRGNENNLETWGFKVVTGTAAAPRKREKKSEAASLDS
jgi:hypothetical protein